MPERNSFPPAVLEQKTQNFLHAYSQVLLYMDQLQRHEGLPFAIEISRDGDRVILMVDERFIQTMNFGVERMYRELCQAGKAEEANQIMTDLRTQTEQ